MTAAARLNHARVAAVLSVAAVAVAASVHCAPSDASDASFHGIAGLCAVDESGVTQEEKDGTTFSYGLVMRFRIETDHDLVTGWETLISNTRADPGGKTFYFGTATLAPDSAPGSTLAGKFCFRSDANPIEGDYVGTGDLENVVVHYELVPADLSALADFCAPGKAPMSGYRMSGTVENYGPK